VKVFLCLSSTLLRHVKMEVKLHIFVTSTLDGGEWPVSQPDHVTQRINLSVSTEQEDGCGPELM